MRKRENIMLKPDEEKEKIYEQINKKFQEGKKVIIKEHKSGFPAISIDCEDICVITDILSLEKWWGKKKEKGRGVK